VAAAAPPAPAHDRIADLLDSQLESSKIPSGASLQLPSPVLIASDEQDELHPEPTRHSLSEPASRPAASATAPAKASAEEFDAVRALSSSHVMPARRGSPSSADAAAASESSSSQVALAVAVVAAGVAIWWHRDWLEERIRRVLRR